MKQTPLIIGHRGACAQAPENTVAAFQLALDVGADGVEFDVQLSSDGVPVVIHDADLNRTGLRSEKVADLTARQLGKIDVGSGFNKKFPKKANPDFAKETVPTLAQVLKLLKGFNGLIYIELKCGDSDFKPLAKAVCDVIRDSPLLSQVIVKSFKLAAIPEVRHHLPEVKTAALFAPQIMDFLRRRNHIIAIAREFGADEISLHHSLVTRRLVSLAAESQMPVTIWTADDPKWLARCSKLGIGALITNDPENLLASRLKSAAITAILASKRVSA
ncbi:MAG: glycerophosphodiester phosphodiesterase family protein [Pyrinomonadaceae bacterium]